MSKKIWSVILGFAMCVSFITSNGATAKASNVVSITKNEQITDVNGLLSMALENARTQNQLAKRMDDELSVKQLIERVEYADGSVEESYAYSIIAVLDDNGNVIPTRKLLDQNRSARASGSNSGYYNNVTIVTTINYTSSMTSLADLSFKLTSSSHTVANANISKTPPVSGTICGGYNPAQCEYYRSRSVSYSASLATQNNTLSYDGAQYTVVTEYPNVWYANTIVNFSNGKEIQVIAYIPNT